MSERKVLNKYIPPNFDASLIPKNKLPKDRQYVVRLMAPFSMRCDTCHEFIYKGRKFNARKETVIGEKYLSFDIYRFYIRCPMCAAEITFKTDPEREDYACEHGAKRNFEPWRDEQSQLEASKQKRMQEEENNPMKALENKTGDSKRELDLLETLDEIRTANALHQKISPAALVDEVSFRHARKITDQARSQARCQSDLAQSENQKDDLLVQEYLAEKHAHRHDAHSASALKLAPKSMPVPAKRKTALDLGIVIKKPK